MRLHKIKGNTGYTTFGSMWEKGKVSADSGFTITSDRGTYVPCQSRVTAYWPDGSVKWAAHTADSGLLGDSFEIVPEEPLDEAFAVGMVYEEDNDSITINNGLFRVRVKKNGTTVFEAIEKNGEILAENAEPELILQEPFVHNGEKAYVDHKFKGQIKEVTVEESGKLQTILRFTGSHVAEDGTERLAFIIRMTVQYLAPEIRFTHTFVYDGDENKDFLKGLGIVFNRPMKGALYNRHIKVTGDNGTFHESVITMVSWRPRTPAGMAEKQMAGELLVPDEQEKETLAQILSAIPYWSEYDVCQDSASHFLIQKKLTGDDFCYIDCLHGNRAKGGLAIGGENGYVQVGLMDFWEKYPSGYTVTGLDGDTAAVHIWLWSPSAKPMDFRHYAERGYNSVCYEGYDYKGADPYGIACTNEFAMCFGDTVTPEDDKLIKFAEDCGNPVLYIAEPEYYQKLHAFGHWSLPCENTEVEKWIENQLEKAFKFYENEVGQRQWYGMFNYGDFMHTYDLSRHNWRYDVGGYAWDNTELVPTLWLWFYFIRTGREDVFRLAEKLTRHTSEVDVYHIGKYKGMGSRHNVRHWGCPCKEARIAMAHHHRVYYYLTGNRRLEDIFDELKDNETTFLNRDPLGDFYDKSQMVFRSHARSGPDWSSLCSNWMTQWERTNDVTYRKKIEVGSEDIKNAPLRLISGPDFEFNPETLHLRYIGERDTGGTHLQICMGAATIWMEMAELMEDKDWKDMLAELGYIYFQPREKQTELTKGLIGKRLFTYPMFAGSLGAFAAEYYKDDSLKGLVWKEMLASIISKDGTGSFDSIELENKANNKKLVEIPWISTNHAAQCCLNMIIALNFIRDALPKTMEEVLTLVNSNDQDSFGKA